MARTAAAYDTTRPYYITASADLVPMVSTPRPRELYVKHLISQARNSVASITGPTTVYVGQTVHYVVNSATATQGYEQLFDFVPLDNTIFRTLAVSATYTAPAGATNDKVYADACGWDNVPTSPTYLSCIGPATYGGNAGGTIVTTYTLQIVGTGVTTLSGTVNDHSGASYHYNSDYGRLWVINDEPECDGGAVKHSHEHAGQHSHEHTDQHSHEHADQHVGECSNQHGHQRRYADRHSDQHVSECSNQHANRYGYQHLSADRYAHTYTDQHGHQRAAKHKHADPYSRSSNRHSDQRADRHSDQRADRYAH